MNKTFLANVRTAAIGAILVIVTATAAQAQATPPYLWLSRADALRTLLDKGLPAASLEEWVHSSHC